MHTDEAVNAYLVGQAMSGNPFRYDATDRHGPALFAVALPLARAQGAQSFADLTEVGLRLTPVIAGTLTLLLFGAAVDLFGFGPCLFAALVTAVAPLPLYYDRYFIHESLLTACTFLLAIAAFRLWQRPGLFRAALVGAAVAMLLATKETALLNIVALVIAALWSRFWIGERQGTTPWRLVQFAAVALGACLLVMLGFYSWFGHNSSGFAELYHLVPRALTRAQGEGHQKPSWYFGQLLSSGRSGLALLVMALAGTVLALRRGEVRLYYVLACYSIAIAAIYSAIPYKTPWLALNLWLPFALLAGVALQHVISHAWNGQHRRFKIAFLLGASILLATAIVADTRKRVYLNPADEDNPYAYAHTSEDLLGLPAAMDRLASERDLKSPRIAVIASDPWPLPWYLRHRSQTGYWQPGQDPGDADFYITSTEAAKQYQTKLQNLRPEFFGLRPGVLILVWSRELNVP